MKLNFNQTITDLSGKTIKQDDKELTLRDVAVVALLSVAQDDRPDGVEKHKRGMLASKIFDATNELEITVEEASKLKDLIGKAYLPLVVFRAFAMIEEPKKEG